MSKTEVSVPTIQVYLGVDGDMYYCHGKNFINIQESPIAFGKTYGEAVCLYLKLVDRDTMPNIQKIIYHYEFKDLDVYMNDGHIYRYKDLPSIVYCEFCESDYYGQFLTERVKGKFRYERIK